MAGHRVSLVCLLVLLLHQSARADWKVDKHPYLCETGSPVLDIKRVFLGYEGVYLALKSKTVFFNLPTVQVDTYRSEQGAVNRTFLAFRDPIQFTNREEPETGKKIVGYVHDHYVQLASKKLYQIHLNESNRNRAGEIVQVLWNQLNQTDGELGKVDMSETRSYLDKIKEEPVEMNEFLIVTISRLSHFMLKISPSGKGTEETYEFCNITHSLALDTRLLYSCVNRTTRHIEQKIKFFTYQLSDIDGEVDDQNERLLHLMQIDADHRIHFSRMLLTISNDEIRIREEFRVPVFTFDELLSCHSPFRNQREVKGIYFDPGQVDFYIIIKRFFIRVQGDLVKTGFRLDEQVYTNALNIKTQLYGTFFELAESKWVKATRTKSYMVTSLCTTLESECMNAYDLTAEAFRINNFTKTEESTNLIVSCPYNTLNIDGKLFCFEEQHYYFFVAEVNLYTSGKYATSERLSRISDIFKNASHIGYNAKQELKFIFNYLNDSFVFMTASSLFVFSYEKFSVNENNEIVVNYASSERVPIFENNLFENLERPSLLNYYIKLLILVLVILLVLLIIYDVCVSGKLSFGEFIQRYCMQKADSPPNTPDTGRDVKLRESFDSAKTSKQMNSLVSGAPLKKNTTMKAVKSEQQRSSQPVQRTSSIRFVDAKR